MTRIFTNGAEIGDTLFWDDGGATGRGNAVTNIKRSGNYAYYFFNAGTGASKTFTGIGEFYLRAAIYFTAIGTASKIIAWRNSTTELGSLRADSAGATNKLLFYTSTGTLVATSTFIPVLNTWYLIEIHVKIADSGGTLELKVDGITDAGASFTGDTKPGTATTVDNLFFVSTGTGYAFYADDLALNSIDNSNGLNDNSWCGDGRVIFISPNGAGDETAWTPSTGDNWECVNEVPPSDTDYVESSTLNQRDLYNLTACGLTNPTILRVWAEARGYDTVAAGGLISLPIKTVSTVYDDTTDLSLLTTSTKQLLGTQHKTNPNTGAAWTTTQLDALQVGVQDRS